MFQERIDFSIALCDSFHSSHIGGYMQTETFVVPQQTVSEAVFRWGDGESQLVMIGFCPPAALA